MTVKPIVPRALALLAVMALGAGAAFAGSAQMGQGVDKRKLTTIQTATLDVGGTKNAVEVRYLNLPFGEKTFQYIAVGGDDYYSTRTWPFAHLKLAAPVTLEGTSLSPGDYVLYITPKSANAPMTLSVASFKPGESGTFLVAGDVFTETPKDAVEVAKIPASFAKGDRTVDHLEIMLSNGAGGAEMHVHYGDHWLTQTFGTK